MKLSLKGHDYKYAAEQIMLMMFPSERPEYDSADSSCLSAEISLFRGNVRSTARTRLYYEGRVYDGCSRCDAPPAGDKLSEDRAFQKIIQLSFYKAAVAATGVQPVWGALTGIRPGKLVTNMLSEGKSCSYAEKKLCREYFVTPRRARLCSQTAKAGLVVKNSLDIRDIALYIGIPFCPTRCAYCSFVSHSVHKSMKLIPPFLDALYKEIEYTSELIKKLGLRVTSVYMGGGTPTTLSVQQLSNLIDKLNSHFDFKNVLEFTVEAGRPDTISEEKLRVLKEKGVTRVSVNPQSMSDDVLEAIGRKHTAKDVLDSVALARSADIGGINMDLIAGLPADTPEKFKYTLDTVMSLRPENITVHTLSLKKGTRVTLEKTAIPDASQVAQMLDYAEEKLTAAGYVPYYLYRQKFMSGGFENVGWCLPGYDNYYNICIMEELCSILALGGGGSTKLVAPKSGRIERVFNPKYPQEYIENIDKVCSSKDYMSEFYDRYVFDL